MWELKSIVEVEKEMERPEFKFIVMELDQKSGYPIPYHTYSYDSEETALRWAKSLIEHGHRVGVYVELHGSWKIHENQGE